MVTSGFACGNTLQDTLRGQCQDPNAPGQKFEIRTIMNHAGANLMEHRF